MAFRRCLFLLLALTQIAAAIDSPPVNTFSIVAFDPASGHFGVAVQSKYFAVGSVVPWAKSGVGAVATQSYAKTSYGPDGLALIASGKSARETLEELIAADPQRALRQVGIIDSAGRVASFTGGECNAWAGHREGRNFAAQGNLLTGPEVVDAMAQAFEKARDGGAGELGDWLTAALLAGQAEGGDKRGQQSAALLVVRAAKNGDTDRFIDLRVDDHPAPIAELQRLLELHKKFHGRPAR